MNNACELVVSSDGEQVYLQSTAAIKLFADREMLGTQKFLSIFFEKGCPFIRSLSQPSCVLLLQGSASVLANGEMATRLVRSVWQLAATGLLCFALVIERPCMCRRAVPQEAKEVAEDADGRFFIFQVTSQTMMILERKGTPEHLHELNCLDKPCSLSELMRYLQDAGEATSVFPKQLASSFCSCYFLHFSLQVKLDVFHHKWADDAFEQTRPLCFLLDDPKPLKVKEEEGKKKPKKVAPWLFSYAFDFLTSTLGCHA